MVWDKTLEWKEKMSGGATKEGGGERARTVLERLVFFFFRRVPRVAEREDLDRETEVPKGGLAKGGQRRVPAMTTVA